jgi:hypothetical protein
LVRAKEPNADVSKMLEHAKSIVATTGALLMYQWNLSYSPQRTIQSNTVKALGCQCINRTSATATHNDPIKHGRLPRTTFSNRSLGVHDDFTEKN